MDNLEGIYCIKIERYGALGLKEEAGNLNLHAVRRDDVETWLDLTLRTLGPGDRAEITLTHGVQPPREEAGG